MAVDGRKAFWIGFGIFSGIGVTYCVSELRKLLREKCTRRPLSLLEDAIQLDDLACLARSPNLSLRRSAEQLILDRAMKDKNLEFIMSACFSHDEVQVLKGIVVIGVLVKSTDFRNKLLHFDVLKTLACCLDHSIDPGYKMLAETGGRDVKLQRVITSSLFDLVRDDDALKTRLGNASSKIVSSVLQLMFASPSKEVMKWCIFVTHQLALSDTVRPQLLENECVGIVSQVMVKNQGDNVLMTLCLQTLVMCANVTEEGEIQALHEMASHNIIPPTVACLKADDSDLVYWATALIHEYSVKDLYKSQICAVPNIVKLLQAVLSTSEAILQRIVLRVISFLCVGNQEFRNKVVQCNSLLARLTVCFASGDHDVVHWAVVLLHDLLLSSGSSSSCKHTAERVVSVCEGIIKALVPLAYRKDNILIRLVAEIIGYFCSVDFPSETLQDHLINDGALEAVLSFLNSNDSDLQYWSSALLLNLSMTSDSVKEEIIRLGGIKPLIELAIGDSEQQSVAAQSAKTLVMLGFVDKQVTVTLKAACPRHGDYSSIVFDGKEYCANECGINICVLDFLTFKITDVLSYDTGHDRSAAGKLVEGIASIPCGTLVFLAVKGEANYFMTDEAMEALKEIGIEEYSFRTGELWAYVGQKRKDHGEQIAIHRSYDNVLLETGICLGRYVNELMQNNILFPVMDLMMSTPPSSAISKVSELELLTIMARHDDHKQVMVGVDGFLEYLAELIWNVASSSSEYLREHPMFLAHSIGALKIISGISISEVFHDDLLNSGVLGAVLSLLYFVNGTALNKINQAAEQVFSPQPSAKLAQDTEVFEEQPSKSSRSDTAVSSEGKAQLLEEVSFDESKKTASPVTHSESSSTPEDFEDAFSTFVRLAITTVYNCMNLFAGVDECRESLFQSGTLHTLWCTLLTSSESTLSQIGLPVEALLNNISCIVSSEKDILENVVELDERLKTPALVLGADNLEAYNMNWTFESVRATVCVGRTRYPSSPHPLGWYYEVILKSNGILQIGWQTEECRYGPEKGVGVGDDHSSCAFDGARCKVWSGPPSEHQNNDYGKEWQYGDVLSCLFSWNGEVSFWINGVDQGVAFSSMNSYVNWFPAASLAMDQHCVFNFGNRPFKYDPPEGYVATSHIVKKKPTVRMVSCWAPLRESFESIVEEDQYPGEESPSKDSGVHDPAQLPPEDVESSHLSFEPQSPTPEEKTTIPEEEDRLPTNQATPSSGEELPGASLTPAKDSELDSHQTEWMKSVSTHAVGQKKRMPVKLPEPATPTSQNSWEAGASSWLQFSPSEALAANNDTPSFPCLYFEADLKNAPSKSRQMGFFDPNTGDKIYCVSYDGQLYLPKTSVHSPSSQECYKCPDVVGCGIMWPAGVVIFTLDGVGTGQYYPFPSDTLLEVHSLLPYISCSRIRCNYGQSPFLFEGANFKEVCYAGANLLHAHGLSDQIKTRNTQKI